MYNNILGIMSGTSCDGIDLCLVSFYQNDNQFTFEIHSSVTEMYSVEMQNKLRNAIFLSGLDLMKLNTEWTFFLVQTIQKHFKRSDYDLISSHGHTVFHQPHLGLTYQIGNLDILCAKLQCDVVGDFRPIDVALGGQGAPLVPIGDEMLFKKFDYCLNLGGIANISFQKEGIRKALDIAPFNLIINQLVSSFGWLMDRDGEEAFKGNLNEDLFYKLNSIDYYRFKNNKSLGKEYIEANYSFIYDFPIALADKLCTFNYHVAFQINQWLDDNPKQVLITGGGAYNKHLIYCLSKINSSIKWIMPENDIINFKEALIFAFLGYLRVNDYTNIYSSYTGAMRNSIAGHFLRFNE